MDTEIPVYLFRVVDDGKVLAEAELKIPAEHNERVWQLFQDSFGNLTQVAIAAIYQTVRIACGQSQVPAGTPAVYGLQIEVKTPTNLIVPEFRSKNGVNHG